MSPINEGGHSHYLNYLRDGCRCDDCTEAWRLHCEKQRQERHAKGLKRGDPRHGKASTYTNWGCHCQRCTNAHKKAKAAAAANTRTAAAQWKG
jgi:hypothetical protein